MPGMKSWLLLSLAFLLPAGAVRAADSTVTIHRCIDAKGRITLQDDPCPKGSQDSTREMLRPEEMIRRGREQALRQAIRAAEQKFNQIAVRSARRGTASAHGIYKTVLLQLGKTGAKDKENNTIVYFEPKLIDDSVQYVQDDGGVSFKESQFPYIQFKIQHYEIS